MGVVIEQKYFDNLKALRNLLKAAIREHKERGGSHMISDEMEEVVHHITKAINILEWDDL
tara:strand:- start:439 stop:618 length:180 start_codon:yes stop_codon:yes gene_type:complete